MSDIRVLIVANGEDAREGYRGALEKMGVAYDAVHCFAEAEHLTVEKSYNGILIDILTLVRSSHEEKVIAYDCINLYPSLRVKWDGKKREMTLGLLEQSYTADTETSLRYFFEQKCRSFPARSLRKHHRHAICLSVFLSKSENASDEESVRTFTVNLSRGGVFVHSNAPFSKGDTVWLRFKEFADQTPIKARVCWGLPWGGRCIPGIGVAFDSLSESSAREIAALTRG